MSPDKARRIKVTIIFTHHIRWVPFELLATCIDTRLFDLDYVILGEADPMVAFLRQREIPVVTMTFDDYTKTPEAVKFVYDHLMQRQPDIVQTHWFAGSLIGLQAAYYANVPVRVFHREHPPIKYYNRHPASKHQLIWDCATHLIAVTGKSKAGMVEDGIPADQITVIPTGFDVNQFINLEPYRVERLKSKYLNTDELKRRSPVIGVAARYVKWKGVEYVIHAFKKVLAEHPQALLIVSGGHVDRTVVRSKMQAACQADVVAHQYDDILAVFDCLSELPDGSYLEIPFEQDLYALFQLFDVFVHVPTDPIQETFGQVYVESMLAKIPAVITLSGSALDHAVHRENAWIVDYQNSDQIADGILTLLSDQSLREKIVRNAFICAQERYEIRKQTRVLEEFYVNALKSSDSHQSRRQPSSSTADSAMER